MEVSKYKLQISKKAVSTNFIIVILINIFNILVYLWFIMFSE